MKLKSLSVVFLIAILLLIVPPTTADQSTTEFTTQKTTSPSLDQSNIWFNEWGWIDISPEGGVYSNVRMQGNAIQFDDLDIEDLVPVEIREIFDWAGVWTRQSNSPTDQNFEVTFRFKTNQPGLAEGYSQALLSTIGSQVFLQDLTFEGSRGFDENYGEGFQSFTEVHYRGHVDWINMLDIIDRSIPRSFGGLAATIDPFMSNSLNFDFWYGNGQFAAGIGLDFSDYVSQLDGSHSFELTELLHVDLIQVADYTDELNIYIRLPTVSNLALSIGNSSSTEVTIRTFDPLEPQHDFSTTHINIDIDNGASFASITFGFDYTFTQWEWKNRDLLWWNIDERGYNELSIQTLGLERVAPTFNLLANQSLVTSTQHIWFGVFYPTTSEPGRHNFYLDVEFSQDTLFGDANATATGIAAEIETLGIEFSESWNYSQWGVEDDYRWNDKQQADVPVEGITLAGYLDSRVQFEALIQNSYIYDRSAVFSATDLSVVDQFNWWVDDILFDKAAAASLRVDPLNDHNPNPTTPFVQNAVNSVDLDLLRPFGLGWDGSIPWNSYSEILSLHVETPFTGDFEAISFTPDVNNGYAWDSGRGFYEDHDRTRFWYDVYIYSGDPQYQDQSSEPYVNTGPMDAIFVNYTSYFYGDGDDLEAPYIPEMWYLDQSQYNYELDGYSYYHRNRYQTVPVSGVQPLALEVFDQSSWVYDGSWSPRYPSSGIENVTSYFFRDDAPIDHPLFTQSLEFQHNSTWILDSPQHQVWDANLDTTTLPDGEWRIVAETYDVAGNFGSQEIGSFNVDNYDETYNPAVIVWDEDSPSEGDGVRDIAYFDFTVIDDVGIYAVVAWNNLGGWMQEPVTTVTNSSGVFTTYSFMVDILAQNLPEDYPFTVSIQVLDMDGHWTTNDIGVYVDNTPVGNPPEVTLISPSDGITLNNSETQTVKFAVMAVDDWGIQSVTLVITGEENREFSMFYNQTSGYYEYAASIEFWAPGDYSWDVEVVDVDENQHTQGAESPWDFHIVGEIVETDDVDPVITLISPGDGDEVSGQVEIEVEVTDNSDLSQVSLTDPDGTESPMSPMGGDTFTGNWDSSTVADGEVELTITARDSSGNTATLILTLVAKNGRTASAPEIGLPGFQLFLSIFSIIALYPILNKRKQY